MTSIFIKIYMVDSRLKGLSIESKNTQIQVLMKELCMFQIMKKINTLQ